MSSHAAFITAVAVPCSPGDSGDESEDDEELAWEAVDSQAVLFSDDTSQTARTTPDPVYDSAARPAHDRTSRKALHQAHTLALLASLRQRNALANDALLHARLISLVPMHLSDAFRISRQLPAQARVDAQDKALRDLLSWWNVNFHLDAKVQGTRRVDFDEMCKEFEGKGRPDGDAFYEALCQEGAIQIEGSSKKGKEKACSHEVIRDAKSLMKRALSLCGSADMSVLLFVALCRGLRLQTRLVASLQPLSPHIATSKTPDKPEFSRQLKRKSSTSSQSSAKKRQRVVSTRMGDEDIARTVEMDTHPSQVAPVPGSSNQPINLDTSMDADVTEEKPLYVKTCERRLKEEPPLFWVEVYSSDLGRWITLDVVRKRLHCERIMAPSLMNDHNQLTYVVACERDGHCRDVTMRYADDWYARGWKARPTDARGETSWWSQAVQSTARRYETKKRDRTEAAELARYEARQMQAFPSIVGDFKDHPRYVLERFLKKDEACYPRAPVGLLWNKTEYVFLRSSVVTIRSALGWQRLGRTIMPKQVAKPVKTYPTRRGSTADEELYAEQQTILTLNKPVKRDGTVQSGQDGLIYLLQPHMMPEGGAHLTFKGAADLAKKRNVPFAKAVVALNTRKSAVVPLIEGIVVSAANARQLQQLYDQDSAERDAKTKEKLALDRWTLLLRRLAIKQRLLGEEADAAVMKADEVDEFDM